ncbi:hypothetical protein LTR56_027419 [Elasticomyces elasticus]|nr:hypothetical protein LTR56_027419 [Elasticomyces elasticus]KAK5733212.1 hypothetical protein LTS12_026986 [Elasticomyces elasticus]
MSPTLTGNSANSKNARRLCGLHTFGIQPSSILMNNLPLFRFLHHLRSPAFITCNLVSPKTAHGEVPSKGQLLKAEALVVASRFSWLLESESVNTIYDTLSHLDFEARHSSETTQLRMANFFDSHLQSNSTHLLQRIVYLASNNMLSEFSAQKLLQEIYQSKDYNLFKTLLSGQSPTMKALARTFLLTGTVTSDVRLARVCLGTGMNLNSFIGNPPKRALAMAVEKGSFKLVHLLLQNGADVNAPANGNPGGTALQAASGKGNIDYTDFRVQ